jgi:hypothetical protein
MINPLTFDQRIVCRIEEFWNSSTHWHRCLWHFGATAAIGELLEASESLPPPSLRALQADVERLTGPDPALGVDTTRNVLRQLLKNDIVFQHTNWHELNEVLSLVRHDYLKRWAHLLRLSPHPGVERVARSVAGYLLHCGFSATYLHRWLQYQVKYRTESLSIADLIEEANSLVRHQRQQYKVIIPVVSAPNIAISAPPEWLQAPVVTELIAKIQGKRTELRQNGGFLLVISACDQYSALEQAKDLVDRWDARAELSTGYRIQLAKQAWVEGFKDPIPLTQYGRQVDIGALSRQNKIYASLSQHETSVRIDDALQLVQPMRMGPRSASISGGWAAIECLLTDGREVESLAAPRLANIIACSFPRAELTTLAFAHREKADDELAKNLKEKNENLALVRILADALCDGRSIIGRGPQDDAACDRMRELLLDPRRTLDKVRDYVTICLNRLYRQRNLMLHGGRVKGDGRSEALFTASPLVGAGLDRICHAWFAENTPPVILSARAEISLQLIGSPSGRHPTELLEPDRII